MCFLIFLPMIIILAVVYGSCSGVFSVNILTVKVVVLSPFGDPNAKSPSLTTASYIVVGLVRKTA